MDRKPVVAFLCVHNACRSQMAEALGRLLAGDVFESCSAGTAPKAKLDPDAVRIMRKLYGIELEREQYPKPLTSLPDVDIVVTMGCGVVCPTLPHLCQEDWGLSDPTGLDDAAFVHTAREIEAKIRSLRARLAKAAP